MDEFDVIAWRAITGEIRRAHAAAEQTDQSPAERYTGFWHAIQRAIAYREHLDDRETNMAKPKPPVPKGGADTGKLGKHHGGNMHGNPKTGSTGKHAAPKGGGKK